MADRLLAPLIVVVLSGMAVFLLTRENDGDPSRRPITAVVVQTSPAAESTPRFPRIRRGQGRTALSAAGSYDGRPFVARSALVLNRGNGVVNVRFLPFRATCATVSAAPDPPLAYSALLTVSPSTVRALPLRRPLAAFSLWWDVREPDGTPVSDEADLRATVLLTVIDTHPGAFWHGRIHATRKSARGRTQDFSGTFAAEWCG